MKRYRFIEFPPKESPNGEWVRWEDVVDEYYSPEYMDAIQKRTIEPLKELFIAAKNYIDSSPCDPDITEEQLSKWLIYQSLLDRYAYLIKNTLKGNREIITDKHASQTDNASE